MTERATCYGCGDIVQLDVERLPDGYQVFGKMTWPNCPKCGGGPVVLTPYFPLFVTPSTLEDPPDPTIVGGLQCPGGSLLTLPQEDPGARTRSPEDPASG